MTDQIAQIYDEIVAERKPTALERIELLSDLSNAARDKEIVDVIMKKPNGQRLYTLFVEAISQEIEETMGGRKQVDNNVTTAAQMVAQMLDMCNRLMNNIGAIERSQTLGILNNFLQKLNPPQQQPQQYQEQYPQFPAPQYAPVQPPPQYNEQYQQQPQQQPQRQPQQVTPARSRNSRVGGLGSP